MIRMSVRYQKGVDFVEFVFHLIKSNPTVDHDVLNPNGVPR